jgi:hypothetical protein
MDNPADTNHPPRLSVLVLMHNSNPKHLLELMYSLIHQKYAGWECVFVCSEQEPMHSQSIIESIASKDERFKLCCVKHTEPRENYPDHGVQSVTGQYLCIAEDTGIFSPMAFHEVSSHLMRFKDTEVIVTDDDMMDDEGVVYATCIKSGCPGEWLLRNASEYPPVFIGLPLLRRLGGFARLASSASGWQEINMAYIPHALYHRRDVGSKLRERRLRRSALQNLA